MPTVLEAPFALGTFSRDGGPRFCGVASGDSVMPLAPFGGITLDILQDWSRVLPQLGTVPAGIPMSELRMHAPVEPRQIFCAGLQRVIDIAMALVPPREGKTRTAGHRAAFTKMMDEPVATGIPFVFKENVSSVTRLFDPIALPREVTQPDWEPDLAVAIGRPARRVRRADIFDYAADYAIASDLTARAHLPTGHARHQDGLAARKGLPTLTPLGPMIVPAASVPNPQDVRTTLKRHGDTMPDGSKSDMLFGIPRPIEYISARAVLPPGDIASIGSPARDGTHHNCFLAPCDVIKGAIAGLGFIRNVCVTETE